MSDEPSAARVLLRPRWFAGHITVVVIAQDPLRDLAGGSRRATR